MYQNSYIGHKFIKFLKTEKPKGAKLPTFRLLIEFALLWTAVAGAVTVPYLLSISQTPVDVLKA